MYISIVSDVILFQKWSNGAASYSFIIQFHSWQKHEQKLLTQSTGVDKIVLTLLVHLSIKDQALYSAVVCHKQLSQLT